MVVLFWIIATLAGAFTIAFIAGFCVKKFVFAMFMNIGLATCSLILNLINIAIKHGW